VAEVRCGSCGQEVPEGNYCVRCGATIGEDPEAARRSRHRRQFAAAPHEHIQVPRLVSTLFPHLPRASMGSFRVSLVFALAVVLVLGLLRILPVALIAAAFSLPLLTLLYLYDVDIYEDEPLSVVLATMAWGAIAGIGVGLLTRAVTDTGAAFLTQPKSTTIVVQGILLPLLGLGLSLLGPVFLLLRWRGRDQFNDVLDGVMFGAGTAVAFAGAEVITYSFSILSGGLRPTGDVLQHLARLTTIAIAIPVLEMAAVGAVSGVLWLRFRSPVRDRNALGPLGNPVIAVILAALLICAGFSLQPLMATGWWLLSLLALDTIALVWLRNLIHLGLLEEAAEIPIGPPITCANCGAQTPRHTFCINCGISLQALPKARPHQTGPAPLDEPAGGIA
jgi:PrsW family intramembrane metalloprotease